jgi:hypothetical protein
MEGHLPVLAELRLRADAFESAAQTATLLAVRNGASDESVALQLAHLQTQLAGEAVALHPRDELARARYALRCRREIARGMAVLALNHDVCGDELSHAMSCVMEAATRMDMVRTPADLGIDAAA